MADNLVFEILEKLVRTDTSNPPGNEKAAAEYLCRLFLENHLSAWIQDVGNGRANVIASYGDGGPEILLCGHLDVVPAAGGWSMPAFELTEKNGKLYGRGTADMKGGVAAMCAALLNVARRKIPLRGKVTLVFVADEECGNLGMRHFLGSEQKAVFAVIGEPTELQVAVAHRGALRDYIDIIGYPQHAALPSEASNAVRNSAKAVDSIFRLNDTLKSYKHPLLPSPSIAVTMINGYEKDNVIPERVRIMTDFRILPGMGLEESRKLEEKALEGCGEYEITEHFYMKGGETDPSCKYVQRCCKVGEKVLKREQKPIAFGASCEQCFLVEKGIPTIICGPGSLDQAHTIDEYVEKDQIRLAEQYYIAMIMDILGGEIRK